MRQAESWKTRSRPREEQIKQSEQIMRRIQQLKEGFAANQSHAKYSQNNREKWEQYLPVDNPHNIRSYFHSVNSKEDARHDHYRQSLEKRLQRLFKQEKQLLKQRHMKDNFSASMSSQKHKQTKKNTGVQDYRQKLVHSESISKMQRKLKTLEEKYRNHENRERQKQPNKIKTEQIQKSGSKNSHRNYIRQERDRIKSEMPNVHKEQSISRDERDWTQKQRDLQLQVEHLKKSIREIKQNNEEILKKIEHKEEKKKHKQRTKDILLSILHKLEFINVEVSNAKKMNQKFRSQEGQKLSKNYTSKLQKNTSELLGQFELLKVQYKHFDEQRKKVEARQAQIETKIKKINEQQK